jgi:hypothetical protein
MRHEHRRAPRQCVCGRPMRGMAPVCDRCRSGDRTWAQVAAEYRRRSGEAITDGAVKECGMTALRKLKLLLQADPVIAEELGIEWVPLDE